MLQLLRDQIPSASGGKQKRFQPLFKNIDEMSAFQIGDFTATLIKNKIKFSTCIRKFRVDQLQSHI
jgi:hypothetical protein